MRVPVWFRRVSDREPKTDRDKQNSTAQDHLYAGGRVDFPEYPSCASTIHGDASRRDPRMVRRKAASNATPCEKFSPSSTILDPRSSRKTDCTNGFHGKQKAPDLSPGLLVSLKQ